MRKPIFANREYEFSRKYIAKLFELPSDKFTISIASKEFVKKELKKSTEHVVINCLTSKGDKTYLISLEEFSEKLNIEEEILVVGLNSRKNRLIFTEYFVIVYTKDLYGELYVPYIKFSTDISKITTS